MPKVAGLGHIGIWVQDLEKMSDFYQRVLGLNQSDRGHGGRTEMVFLSARDRLSEHHETVLAPGGEKAPQQISYYVNSLDELKAFHQVLLRENVHIIETVSHGYALGIYFLDPEGNRLEIYWKAGRDVAQPFKRPIDLSLPDEALLAELDADLRGQHERGVAEGTA